MKKKIVILTLALCTIGLIGCDKKEEWSQADNQLGEIKQESEIPQLSETIIEDTKETEQILETIETEIESSSGEGMSIGDFFSSYKESEGDLTNDDFNYQNII